MNIIDVGAGAGKYAIDMAKLGHTVWAFEPFPDKLKESVMAKSLQSKVYIVDKVVAGADGPVLFNGSILTDLYVGGPMVFIDAVKIDSMIWDKIDVIKIDAVGAELEVLRGAHDTIIRWGPKITINLYPELVQHVEHRVLDWVNNLDMGYKSCFTGRQSSVHYIN